MPLEGGLERWTEPMLFSDPDRGEAPFGEVTVIFRLVAHLFSRGLRQPVFERQQIRRQNFSALW
jgi:hypothetical protein